MATSLQKLHEDNLKCFNNLLKCLANQEPLALVGSGLVIRAGYPSWPGLIQKLHVLADVEKRWGPNTAKCIQDPEVDPLFRADFYRSELERGDPLEQTYFRFLRRTFQPSRKPLDDTLRRFVKLPFSHFMTTNYDPTLQKA